MRICFIDRSTKLETVNDLEARARGGMVTSLFKVSDYLSSKGNDVVVYSDIQKPCVTKSGVFWDNKPPQICDFVICNRGVSGFDIQTRQRILWTHDLPHAGQIPEPKNIKAFSATVFMSQYAERIWRYYYKDIGRSFYIPNGVDKDTFYPRKKDLSYLIYASAPNRGLKRLPLIFDAISARVNRPLRMKAYSNLAKLHPNEVDERDDLSETYNAVRESKVELMDPVPQAQFAEELGKASLMILPSSYPEICSNVILQSLASGTPVITTGRLGSACEWVDRWNGSLTEWQPHDYMAYTMNIVRDAVEILEDEFRHWKLITNAPNGQRNLNVSWYSREIQSWDQIGAQWLKMLEKLN